jgi:hypothetical protein
MPAPKRRGRPSGTDYREDLEALGLVANILTDGPHLRPAAAIRQVMRSRKWPGASDNAILTRLQRKWKVFGPGLLELVRERRAQRPMPQPAHDIFAGAARAQTLIEKYGRSIDNIARMQKALENPALQAWIRGNQPLFGLGQASAFTKQVELMEKTFNSPAMKAWREKEREMTRLMQSPAVQFMQNYMQKVRVAEHAFPPRVNFHKKLV